MKKIFSLLAAVLMAGSMMAQDGWINFSAVQPATEVAGSTYGSEGFTLVIPTESDKATVDANNCTFGLSAEEAVSFTHRLKTGGASSKAGRKFTLNIPEEGPLAIYARTGKAAATNRNFVIANGSDTIVNHICLDTDTVEGASSKIFLPVIVENVPAGSYEVTYPVDGINFYGFELIGSDAPAAMDTVYFVNAADWAAVKIHTWDGTAAGTTWPGLDVEKADYQLQGKDVYFFVAEAGAYGKCIFNNNNNGAQTANLDWTPGMYYYNGSWMTREELEAPVVVDMYLKHNWAENPWTWKQMTYDAETETYLLREVYGATGCNWNTSASDTGSAWVASPTVVGNPAAGDSAVFAFKNGEITITKIGEANEEPTTRFMKHNWAGLNAWTWKEMTREGETDTYTLRDIYGGTGCNWNTIGEDAGATWVATPTLVGEPAVGDSAVFTLTEGAITITKIMGEVGPEPVITKDTAYYFAGETTEWAFAAMPYTVALPKDSTIEFKQVMIVTTTSTLAEEAPVVAHDTIWCGQMTEGYVMTRESMTEAGWMLDGTYNVVLTADAEGDYVFAMNGAALTVTFPAVGPAPEPAIDTLYLVNSKGWGAPKIYFYGGTVGQITAWPGDAMVKVEDVKADGFDVYMFAINHGEQANVIFNNGGSVQSGDLVIAGNEGKYFNFADQTWYESAEAVVCTWYMNANYNGTTEWRELTRGEGTFSRRDVYAPATNYYYNGMAVDKLKSEIKGAKLTIDSELAAGDSAVFTLDPYAKTINITKIASEGPGPEPTVNYYLAGSMNAPAWSSVAMPGDSIVLNLEAGVHQFKVQLAEGNWDGAMGYDNVNTECSSEGLSTNNDGNVVFTLDEAGEVVIRVVDGQICVTGAFSTPEPTLPEVDLKGINNDWAGVRMEAAEDQQTCSYTYTLAAGEYEFKLYIEGAWLGNNGTMTRDNCTGWTFDASAGNCHLTADIDGDYIFTYEYESGKMSVTYPVFTPTGVDNAEMGELKKMIQNGQLVIIREGKAYNALGAQL